MSNIIATLVFLSIMAMVAGVVIGVVGIFRKSTKHQKRGAIVIAVAAVIFVASISQVSKVTEPVDQPLQQTDRASAQQAHSQSDSDLFISFRRSLMDQTSKADSMFEPFKMALQRGDAVSALAIAHKIKSPTLSTWGDIKRLETPDLENKVAKNKLDVAKDAIAGAYLYKANFVRDWIKFSESQDVKKLATLKDRSEDINSLLHGGINGLTEVASMLGVKADSAKGKE